MIDAFLYLLSAMNIALCLSLFKMLLELRKRLKDTDKLIELNKQLFDKTMQAQNVGEVKQFLMEFNLEILERYKRKMSRLKV